MCTVLLPPGDNPVAVNKYIISYSIINGDAAGTPSIILPVPSSYVPPQRIPRLVGASDFVTGFLLTNCAMLLYEHWYNGTSNSFLFHPLSTSNSAEAGITVRHAS
jgi:hypothetical protein